MSSWKQSIALACAASVLSFGVAMAQTDPNAAPAAPATMAPAPDAAASGDTMKKPMMKKHMMKKHMSKKMMKKSKTM